MQHLGHEVCEQEVENIFRQFDKDHSHKIEFIEFLQMMEHKLNLNAFQESIFDVFKIFDRKNSGFIIRKEIKFTFHNLGIELGDTEI